MRKPLVVMLLVLAPILLSAFASGPPDGRTGAPGEGVCADCHNSFSLNSGDGSLTITAPDYYEAGETYTITVELADPGQQRWGFELTPKDQGSITITDPTNTQLSTSGSDLYVKHTTAGTYNGTADGPVSWSFDWTAPSPAPDSVIFYVAGNAANGNSSSQGDYIYTASATSHSLAAIPTLTEWGLIIFALLILTMVTIVYTRQRKTVAEIA